MFAPILSILSSEKNRQVWHSYSSVSCSGSGYEPGVVGKPRFSDGEFRVPSYGSFYFEESYRFFLSSWPDDQSDCDRYPTRDRSGASDRSVTCDRFFEEAGNALS
jgi:hypothetical protein